MSGEQDPAVLFRQLLQPEPGRVRLDHRSRLFGKDTGQYHLSAPRQGTGEVRRQIHEGAGQYVGDQQIAARYFTVGRGGKDPVRDLVPESVVPRGLQGLQDELQRNLRSGLESTLGRLNLVTREEFEVQQAVLLRTRQKLEALEARLAELENGTRD